MDDKKAHYASLADGVIAELREGGELHSEGSFTLDREMAREKLGDFQLPNPLWSLLLIVRAAVRRGAGSLDIAVDTDDIRLAFDGPVFDEHDFEDLYSDPLSERVDEQHAGRQELALGLNASLAMEPRYVRVVSGDAELELRPGKTDRFGPAEEPRSGTLVHIKLHRFLMVRAMASYGEVLPEVDLLRERCRYADIPVTVNEKLVSEGLALGDAIFRVALESEDMQGAVGVWPQDSEPIGVRVVKHGVWIAELASEAVPWDVGFVIRADGIQTDLTQFVLVEDQAHSALLEAIEQGARKLLDALAAGLGGHGPTARLDRASVRGTLRQAQWRFSSRDCYTGDHADPLAATLFELEVWPTLLTGADGGGYRSLRWLLEIAEHGPIVYMREDHDVLSEEQLHEILPRLEVPCLRAESGGDAKLLQSLLEDQLIYFSNHPTAIQILDTLESDSPEVDEVNELNLRNISYWVLSLVIGFVIFAALSGGSC